jgi:hypothetical protein
MNLDMNTQNIILVVILVAVVLWIRNRNEKMDTIKTIPDFKKYKTCCKNTSCSRYNEHQPIYYGNSTNGYIQIPFEDIPARFYCNNDFIPVTAEQSNKLSANGKYANDCYARLLEDIGAGDECATCQ